MAVDAVHLYYIAWSDKTVAAMPDGYAMLDNTAHERDDWREYWPIRRFLLNESLDENALYGFFSPRFVEKTGLAAQDVRNFIGAHLARTHYDVFTFSPQADMGAFFLNVFEQEDLFQPGFIDAAALFFDHIGVPADLRNMIMDSRQIVFSNYMVARPAFWRRWLALNEHLFALCEGPDSPVKQAMTFETTYPGKVQRKVFLMERIASFLLTAEPQWKVRAYDTFMCAWSGSKLNQFRDLAVLSDALKIAMREQGFAEYIEEFAKLRDRLR